MTTNASIHPPAAFERVALDDAVVQSGFTAWSDAPGGARLARSQLQLAGLYCTGCAGIVERALLQERGVTEARVDYAAQRATVGWDPALTRLSSVIAAVRKAGYDAVPDAAASARTLRRAEQRGALWRLFVALFCMMQVMMYAAPLYLAEPGTLTPDLRALLLWAAWLLSLPVVLFSAAPIFRDAFAALRQRRVAMDLPVALGIAVTFIASSGAAFDPGGVFGHEAYFDSLTMFVSFLLGGRFIALMMRHRATAVLEAAVTRLPAVVRRVEADGSVALVAWHRLVVGDRVRVLVGEAFPADGAVQEGATTADEALLTGESRPVVKGVGDRALAGSLNVGAPVVQAVERLGADTRYEGIAALLRSALTDRPPLWRAADRVAGPFLWGVLLLAAAAGAVWSVIDPSRAVWVSVSVLIVTCPCALSLAAPSAYLAAAAALTRRGVLVQRFEALEALAALDTVCFDKTGTLTSGRPGIAHVALQPAAFRAGLDAPSVLGMAAPLAVSSTHPLSAAIVEQAQRMDGAASSNPMGSSVVGGAAAVGLAVQGRGATDRAPPFAWTDVHEQVGCGLEASGPDGGRYRLGAAAWVREASDRPSPIAIEALPEGPQAWFGGPNGPLAAFVFGEALRPDAAATVEALQRAGLAVRLLSGDAVERVQAVASTLGIDSAQGGATPADKLAAITALQRAGHRVGMVGDGLNDAPVMARADASFAIGEGTALTRAKADFILVSGNLADIVSARDIAQRAMRIVRQNLGWAIAYNATCVPLALLGWFPPWLAGLGMATSSLVVVLNALRIDRARP